MKILITGIAGSIGSHLAERLLSLGHEVSGIDALTSYYSPEIKKLNAKEVEMKGGKVFFKNLVTDDVGDLVLDSEAIFHLAAQPGISSTTPFEDYLHNNFIATHKLVEVARQSKKLKIFINASTSSVYGKKADGDENTETKPSSYYGVTKLASEQLAMAAYRDKDFPATSFRFFSVYGPRERTDKFFSKLIRSMYEENEVPFHEGSENHIRSYTYIDDVVDACVLALDNYQKTIGEILNIGNDETATTGDVIKIAEKIMSKKAKLKILPKREGDQIETAAVINKAHNILGFNPKVNLEEGLSAQIKWYGEKIHNKIKI